MNTQNCFPAPAKINHFLHVTGQRPDGYHLLQTLFQYLDYGDSLSFDINKTGAITRVDNHAYNLPKEDLCVKAANALKLKTKRQNLGTTIRLTKRIPPGTGLGAGSSNAATTLLALNKLWQINLSQSELMDIGKTLGADVAFFIYGQSAWAEGVGDQFTPYTPKEQWCCVLLPNAQVPTANIFADSTLKKNHIPITANDFETGNTKNDLETITIQHYPIIGKTLDYLNQYGLAKMSGTGSAIFATFDHKPVAEQALINKPQNCNGFVAKSVNQHTANTLFEQFSL